MTILMKDLDKPKVEQWLDFPAKHGLSHEPAFVFVCAWIAFNYVYGVYCLEHRGELLSMAKKGTEDKLGDRQQWKFFIQAPDFKSIFNYIKIEKNPKGIFDLEMPRRIHELLSPEKYHPERKIIGAFPLRTLNEFELFDLIYTVRNNLFHGGKKVDSNEDRPVLEVTAEFLSQFMSELLKHIEPI